MLNQKGFAPIFVILIVIVILSSIGGGSYYLGSKTNLSNSRSTNIKPSNTNKSAESKLVKINSSTSANSSKNSFVQSNYTEFDSPCMNFKYPNAWEKVSFNPITTHQSTVNGLDSFGQTSVKFEKSVTDDNINNLFTITVSCEPLLENSAKYSSKYLPVTVEKVFHKENEAWLVTHNSTPKDKINATTPGVQSLQGHKGNTNYTVQVEWENSQGDNINNSTRKEYFDLLASMIIRDSFKKIN